VAGKAGIYNITMSREFFRDLERLPPNVYRRALQALDRMLQDPWATELHPEKIQRAEAGVRSCQADHNYRIIWKHIKPNDIVLCLVDSHDEAYRRAARKSFTLQDGVVKVADVLEVGARAPEQPSGLFGWMQSGKAEPGKLFIGYRDQDLLELGVPQDVLPHIRALEDANELPLVERLLSVEVYDRLVAIALDIIERPVVPDVELRKSLELYQGGDDLYRFVDSEEFKRALAGSLEDWMLFLAPHQRVLINRSYNGPARIKGVAGSGKTVVAIHRARHLARKARAQNGKVLFLTYGSRLPCVIEHLLRHLAGAGAPELSAVECATVHQWCRRFLAAHGRTPAVDDSGDAYRNAIGCAKAEVARRFPALRLWFRPDSFFEDEIKYAIKGRAIATLDEYLALERSGRGTPLRAAERRAVYAVYEAYQRALQAQGLWDFDDFIVESLRLVESGVKPEGYLAAVVDEIQDLSEAVIRLIRAIIPPLPDDLFLVGDGLQRIYPGGYALGRLGINVIGRGAVLRRNYRNTQEIMRAAHAMMHSMRVDDLEDTEEEVVEPEYSVRHGELPVLRCFGTPDEEMDWVVSQITDLKARNGYQERDFAILYRWRKPYMELVGKWLSPRMQLVEIQRDASSYFGPGIKHTSFHSAKGLEFKVVFVVGVADGQFVPRDDWSLEGEALEDYITRERRLLYVAMTRARDLLFLTCSRGQPSRFLSDIPTAYLQRI
jgi:superfamily I DNA/RNA helicase/mRNA-degrading endonuclease RelE of RelBE toxin-antitoxin system